jgi:hypothetical protein
MTRTISKPSPTGILGTTATWQKTGRLGLRGIPRDAACQHPTTGHSAKRVAWEDRRDYEEPSPADRTLSFCNPISTIRLQRRTGTSTTEIVQEFLARKYHTTIHLRCSPEAHRNPHHGDCSGVLQRTRQMPTRHRRLPETRQDATMPGLSQANAPATSRRANSPCSRDALEPHSCSGNLMRKRQSPLSPPHSPHHATIAPIRRVFGKRGSTSSD